MGRATQGVTLMALDEGAQRIGVQRIVENDASEEADADNATDAESANND